MQNLFVDMIGSYSSDYDSDDEYVCPFTLLPWALTYEGQCSPTYYPNAVCSVYMATVA